MGFSLCAGESSPVRDGEEKAGALVVGALRLSILGREGRGARIWGGGWGTTRCSVAPSLSDLGGPRRKCRGLEGMGME